MDWKEQLQTLMDGEPQTLDVRLVCIRNAEKWFLKHLRVIIFDSELSIPEQIRYPSFLFLRREMSSSDFLQFISNLTTRSTLSQEETERLSYDEKLKKSRFNEQEIFCEYANVNFRDHSRGNSRWGLGEYPLPSWNFDGNLYPDLQEGQEPLVASEAPYFPKPIDGEAWFLYGKALPDSSYYLPIIEISIEDDRAFFSSIEFEEETSTLRCWCKGELLPQCIIQLYTNYPQIESKQAESETVFQLQGQPTTISLAIIHEDTWLDKRDISLASPRYGTPKDVKIITRPHNLQNPHLQNASGHDTSEIGRGRAADELTNTSTALALIQVLISESKELEITASKLQQGENVGLGEEEIKSLVERYSSWYSRSLSILPTDLQQRFRSDYEGTFWNPKIKKFFEAATEPSVFYTQNETGKTIFPFWGYPFEQNFYPYFLDQRQLLIEASVRLSASSSSGQVPTIEELIAESKELEITASKIQQGENVGLSADKINAFVEKYHVWFGHCLSQLPNDLKDKFRFEYEGTWYALKIKKFLEAPIQRNPLFTENLNGNELKLLSYWLYPYDSTFRNPLLAQRQLLMEVKERKLNPKEKEDERKTKSNRSAKVNGHLFEQLIEELLHALHFVDIKSLEQDYGFDLQAVYPSKSLTGIIVPQVWLISIKYRNTPQPQAATTLTRYITSLLSSPQANNVAKMLFIDYSNLTSFGKEYADALTKEFGGRIEIWDRDQLDSLLSQFPQLLKKYENIITKRAPSLSVLPKTNQINVAERLRKCKPGQEDWREFENICIDVLTEAFVPPLKRVEPQARTESGLERRDALLPLLGAKEGWEEISQKYDAHFLLCEFKNYVDPIDKGEVNQAANYLKRHIGRMGIIFSRIPPSPSALHMRRSVYADERKLILFFEDEHLLELLKLKEVGQNPLQLIQDAILNFLLKYE